MHVWLGAPAILVVYVKKAPQHKSRVSISKYISLHCIACGLSLVALPNPHKFQLQRCCCRQLELVKQGNPCTATLRLLLEVNEYPCIVLCLQPAPSTSIRCSPLNGFPRYVASSLVLPPIPLLHAPLAVFPTDAEPYPPPLPTHLPPSLRVSSLFASN